MEHTDIAMKTAEIVRDVMTEHLLEEETEENLAKIAGEINEAVYRQEGSEEIELFVLEPRFGVDGLTARFKIKTRNHETRFFEAGPGRKDEA